MINAILSLVSLLLGMFCYDQNAILQFVILLLISIFFIVTEKTPYFK